MPIELSEAIEYEHSDGYTLVDEGWVKVHVFEATPLKKDDDRNKPYYKVTYRIDGGDFDGVDVKENFLGMYGRAIFKLYDLASALGDLAVYYDEEKKQWHHLPAPADLEGKGPFWLQVEHEVQQSKRDGELQWEADGSPKWVTFMRPTIMLPGSVKEADLPKFRKTLRSSAAPQAGGSGTPQYQGGGAATSAAPSAAASNSDDPWAS